MSTKCETTGNAKVVADRPYDRSLPLPTVTVLYHYKPASLPGKSVIGLLVDVPPKGSTPPHRHGTASVAAVCIEGKVYNKMNDEPTYLIESPGSWYEAPGCHHKCSDNASETETAKILATMILDTKTFEEEGPKCLVVNDPEYADIKINVIV